MPDIKNPLIDAVQDEQSSMYQARLERQVVGLTILLAQVQTVFKVITGYDSEELIAELGDKTVKELADEEAQRRMDTFNAENQRASKSLRRGSGITETPFP